MITVVGLGFVGLTTALGFCEKGFKVVGIDVDSKKINDLKNGKIAFHEPELPAQLNKHLNKNFHLETSLCNDESEVIFICVGTPGKADGSSDLSYILSVLDQIIKSSCEGQVKTAVIKSTVPPSTISNQLIPYLQSQEYSGQINLASNPEFLREGYAWDDFINPDRIVLGVEDESSKELLNKIYKSFDAPLHFVSTNSAEFIKYLSNSLLSTMISFANEMSMIADHVGDIDIKSAFKILHEDKRWFGHPANMKSYVYPGCGYGGYCLPKDTEAIAALAESFGYDASLLKANLEVNSKIKKHIIQKISSSVKRSDSLGILGLSFKPDSDDVRSSPSQFIIDGLLKKGFRNIFAFDPMANTLFDQQNNFPITYCQSIEEIVGRTDNLIILTGWKDFYTNRDLIKTKNVFDFRYILT